MISNIISRVAHTLTPVTSNTHTLIQSYTEKTNLEKNMAKC